MANGNTPQRRSPTTSSAKTIAIFGTPGSATLAMIFAAPSSGVCRVKLRDGGSKRASVATAMWLLLRPTSVMRMLPAACWRSSSPVSSVRYAPGRPSARIAHVHTAKCTSAA